MIKLSRTDKAEIRSSLRTKYDNFISLPEDFLTKITHKLSHLPKNLTTLHIGEVESLVLSNLSQNEPLLANLSQECLSWLSSAIRGQYYGQNILDLDEGGDGLVLPTFVEIISDFVFTTRVRDFKDLKNEYDKQFYQKYFWCFEIHGVEIVKYLNKVA